MKVSAAQVSPHLKARITGLVYLLFFVTTILGTILAGRGFVVLGTVLELISVAFYVAVTILFYYMFKPVNNALALLATLFSLVGCVVTALADFNAGPNINPLAFFGPFNLLIGYLIFRSSFLPRVLGVLMALSGVGWLIFVSPLGPRLATLIMVVGILAEGLLMLWLLAMGVNDQRWNEQAGA